MAHRNRPDHCNHVDATCHRERVARGLKRALSNPPVTDPNVPAWAIRSKRAHLNALENLAVFAPVVIAAVLMGTTGGTVLLAVKVYVFARVIHYIVYTAGIPVARTLSFVTGASAIGVS